LSALAQPLIKRNKLFRLILLGSRSFLQKMSGYLKDQEMSRSLFISLLFVPHTLTSSFSRMLRILAPNLPKSKPIDTNETPEVLKVKYVLKLFAG